MGNMIDSISAIGVGLFLTGLIGATLYDHRYQSNKTAHNSLPAEMQPYDTNTNGLLEYNETQKFSQDYEFRRKESDLASKTE